MVHHLSGELCVCLVWGDLCGETVHYSERFVHFDF